MGQRLLESLLSLVDSFPVFQHTLHYFKQNNCTYICSHWASNKLFWNLERKDWIPAPFFGDNGISVTLCFRNIFFATHFGIYWRPVFKISYYIARGTFLGISVYWYDKIPTYKYLWSNSELLTHKGWRNPEILYSLFSYFSHQTKYFNIFRQIIFKQHFMTEISVQFTFQMNTVTWLHTNTQTMRQQFFVPFYGDKKNIHIHSWLKTICFQFYCQDLLYNKHNMWCKIQNLETFTAYFFIFLLYFAFRFSLL